MPGDQTRLEILVDLFQLAGQRAQVLPSLRAGEFVQAILEEFTEFEQLDVAPTGYQLVRVADRTPLDEALPLGQQLRAGDRVRLQEKVLPLPVGTQRPAHDLYLRDQANGRVYKLQWLPALIGRTDPTQPRSEWLAVDCHGHAAGQRVSRRQAQIIAVGDLYFIETLSQNPTLVVRGSEGARQTLAVTGRQPLEAGDLIRLERSKITLKFIVIPTA